jgi:hypothetical protein
MEDLRISQLWYEEYYFEQGSACHLISRWFLALLVVGISSPLEDRAKSIKVCQ